MRGRYKCKSDCLQGPLKKDKIYTIWDNTKWTEENMECKHLMVYDDGMEAGINDYWFNDQFNYIGPIGLNVNISVL